MRIPQGIKALGKALGKCILYLLKILPGWAFVLVLVYWYVYLQRYLIQNDWVFFTVIGVGIAVSFLFSALEMALASLDLEFLRKMEERNDEATRKRHQNNIDEATLAGERKKVSSLIHIYYRKEKLNAPIVLASNVANIFMTAFVPFALVTGDHARRVTIDFSWLAKLSICGSCQKNLPGVGKETLTFFSVALLIIVVGKIIPKKLGRHFNHGFVVNCRGLIEAQGFLFGWLGTALLAVVEIPLNVIEYFRRTDR